jgi:hypothetical protein
MQTVTKFRGTGVSQEGRLKMNTKHYSIIPLTIGLASVLLLHFSILTPLSAAASSSPTATTEWKLYEPVAEVVVPTGDVNVPRAVEEKDGYVYLLAREGILYTYDISDLPLQESFTTYNTPVYKQTSYNGNGLLRHGNNLYVFGSNGIQTIDVQNPGMPSLLGLTNDLNIYNMVRYENYLIAAGRGRIAVYSIDEPSDPTLLSDLNMGEEQLVWSAAAYGNTLYVCNWTSDWQGSYTNYLSIIDFSNPANLSVLNTISRDDQAYHLRVIGNQLVECTSGQARLWDLTTPANPVFLASQQAGGRVVAQDGDNIVTNGTVLRPNGNELQIVTTFMSGGSQQDGYPHGSAVNTSYVFIAQSKRILILNASMPPLSINHASGGAGSFFTITGHGFPPNSTATLVANSYTLGDVDTDAAGDCLFLLDTEQADEGRYVVKATLDPSASTNFVIASGEPIHPQEGDGTIFQIPSGIAYATYSGGNGTADDPYQIATAADLIALGETPEDYDKHFILTADIDLDPNLPGRKVFNKAVIAPDVNDLNSWFDGTSFTGVFDGNSYTVSNLIIAGGHYLGLFGRLESGAEVKDLGVLAVNIAASGDSVGGLVGHIYRRGAVTDCYSTGTVSGSSYVGGLVGSNDYLPVVITRCYSEAEVSGGSYVGGLVGSSAGKVTVSYSRCEVAGNRLVGGLVGWNLGSVTHCFSISVVSAVSDAGGLIGGNGRTWVRNLIGHVSDCYSAGAVSGTACVGGLVGSNGGDVTHCYNIGAVSSTGEPVGGLVGCGFVEVSGYEGQLSRVDGSVINCFWDTQTSSQAGSEGGTGKTTAEMQTAATFLDAGWDFVGETANGTDDVWWILEGQDYPRLWWETE